MSIGTLPRFLITESCPHCGKPVYADKGYYSTTGAHWDCHSKSVADLDTATKAKAAIATLTGKRPKRARAKRGTETKSGGSFNWTINQAGEAILASPAFQVALSPGEMAFMTSVLDEAGEDVGQGTMVSFDHTEGRAVSGLAKKGLVVRHKGEVELTELGTTWLRNSAHLRVES